MANMVPDTRIAGIKEPRLINEQEGLESFARDRLPWFILVGGISAVAGIVIGIGFAIYQVIGFIAFLFLGGPKARTAEEEAGHDENSSGDDS